jgi:DNA-binding transcriptional ArsR family regulator
MANVDLTDAKIVKALSHPVRQQVLSILDERVASPTEIAVELGETLGVVSYHVGVLRDLELIRLTGTTPRRGALEHHYCAVPRASVLPRGLAALPDSVRRRQLREQLTALVGAVTLGARSGELEQPDAVVLTRRLRLDERGRRELAKRLEKLLAAVDRLEAESFDRGAADLAVSINLVAFDEPVE